MAIEQPKPTKAEQREFVLKLAGGFVIGTIMAGVVGPIILAIIVGEIWGH